MELVNILRNKKIKVIEIPKWGAFLRKQWEDSFANHLSPSEKKEIFLNDSGGYLWHLFSYEKRACLQGEEANKAFNSMPKNSCYVFYQRTNEALILDGAFSFSVGDLLEETDIYIVDKEFNWTYIKTHETGYLGPYFSLRGERV